MILCSISFLHGGAESSLILLIHEQETLTCRLTGRHKLRWEEVRVCSKPSTVQDLFGGMMGCQLHLGDTNEALLPRSVCEHQHALGFCTPKQTLELHIGCSSTAWSVVCFFLGEFDSAPVHPMS